MEPQYQPLSKTEIAIEKILEVIERIYLRIKGGAQPLMLRYDFRVERELRAKYQSWVQEGMAEYVHTIRIPSAEEMRINPPSHEQRYRKVIEGERVSWVPEGNYVPDYGEYRSMRKTYERQSWLPVGIYDDFGNFTGQMEIYRYRKQ